MSNKFELSTGAFRFYEDGTEAGAVAIAAAGVNVTRDISSDNQLHLRYRTDEFGAGSVPGASTDDYTIQYRVNGGGSWNTITASSARVQTDTASDLTDDGATTQRLLGGGGSFFAGIQEEGDGEVTDFLHEADNHTEHVWALDLIAADWTESDFVQFRMRINGGAMNNPFSPQITFEVAAAARRIFIT